MPMGEMHIFLYRLGLVFYKIYESKRKGSQVFRDIQHHLLSAYPTIFNPELSLSSDDR